MNETNIGREVAELREENVKHYYMGDGTYQAIAFSHPKGTDYRNTLENTEDYHRNCIYGENKNHQTVILDRTVCQGCRNKISAYRAAHMDD